MKKKKLTPKQKRIAEMVSRGTKILFGDAKQSWERGLSVCSAIFWTWLEFSFLRFLLFFMIDVGVYAGTGSVEIMVETIKRNVDFLDLFIKIYFIAVLVFRIPIHYGKKIQSEGDTE